MPQFNYAFHLSDTLSPTMLSLTRKEQIVLLGLGIALFVGGILAFVDWMNPDAIEEFQVLPRAVAPPEVKENRKIQPAGSDHPIEEEQMSLLEKINLNRATAAELQTLPRIGPKIAERIVAFREKNGPFRSVRDLEMVPGIGRKTLEQIVPFVTVE